MTKYYQICLIAIIAVSFNSCNPGEHRADSDLSYIHSDSLSERNIILKEILDITVEDDNPILAFYYLN
jgi:hypothetical protein